MRPPYLGVFAMKGQPETFGKEELAVLPTICLILYTQSRHSGKYINGAGVVRCLPAVSSLQSRDKHAPSRKLNNFCLYTTRILPRELGGGVPLRYDRARQPPGRGVLVNRHV